MKNAVGDRERRAYHHGYSEEKKGLPCNKNLYKNANEKRWYLQGHYDAQKELRSNEK